MNSQQIAIREQQKDLWNKFSAGWKKWDDHTKQFLKPMGDVIIDQLRLKEDDVVLDIASGTGEPALTIASIVRNGKVIATDVAEQMLAVAEEIAGNMDVKNMEVKRADVCELDFEDNYFDKVSCRMGFMFFPDMETGAREMFRVLKPGGRMATSVWGQPEDNPWATSIMDVIKKHVDVPRPPPGSPGLFRCAEPGLMKEILTQAGFKNIVETEVMGETEYESVEEFWQMMNDIAAPIVNALSDASITVKNKIKEEVHELLKDRQTPGNLKLGFSAIVFSADK